jgi:hypothetical protein
MFAAAPYCDSSVVAGLFNSERLTTNMEFLEMKSGLLLSATASLMMMGSTAVFAQSYAAPGAITLKPGQVQSVDASSQAPGYSTQTDVGVVGLKPGQTMNTASSQDLGSVQAGATSFYSGFNPLKPGQAG